MKRGFSLIEMLVALALFASVVIVAVGSIVILIQGQKKSYFLQTNQDNVRFAIEAISREIRTGINYTQDTITNQQPLILVTAGGPVANCQTIDNSPLNPPVSNLLACIQFVNADGELVVIKESRDTTECGVPAGVIAVSCIAKSSTLIPIPSSGVPAVSVPMADFQPMTAPEVDIQGLNFIVVGEAKGDDFQSRVTIVIRAATPGIGVLQTRLDVQTTVSQLKIDS